ncbi:polysaccharide deacetylase family protein [Jiangella muralis]|uniref:polysaccharide deacetylase family protein n=1 Tax=Jiangella muralis TaxID=702383 RepID=UPI000A407A96|nr:polysaccharide deacetylase family protein [Jiangella muralis]
MRTRDLVGYGRRLPAGRWPNGARLAVSLVLNYEEGSERSFAMGDADQETGTEWGQYPYPAGIANLAMESMYEYGSRVGVWRIFDIADSFDVPLTIFACAQAFELNPDVAAYVRDSAHEVCSHGYRWEEVFRLTEQEEAEHIRLAVASLEKTVGRRPAGWYCRYGPSTRTRELLVAEGGFRYDSDSYADDAPYFVLAGGERRLVVPYSPDVNDFRFWQANGPATAALLTEYLTDSFDELYRESERTPRMLSFGLHPRIIGRPGRIRALRDFIEYALGHDGVWFATREEIADAWLRRDAVDVDEQAVR